MSIRDITQILVRFSGLLIIVSGLGDMPQTLASGLLAYRKEPELDLFVAFCLYGAPSAISTGTGVLLYVLSARITDRFLIIADSSITGNPAHILARKMEETAIAVFGLYLAGSGGASLTFYYGKIDLYYSIIQNSSINGQLAPGDFGGIISGIFRVLTGISLFFLAKWIITLRKN